MYRMSKFYIFQLSWNYNNFVFFRRNGGCYKNEDVFCFIRKIGSIFGWIKVIGMMV